MSLKYTSSEGLGIATHPTAKSKLFTSWRVLYVQWTLCPLQWLGTGADGTLGELGLCHARKTLEIIVTRVAEMGSAEAEVDGHRAAVAALVLQEVCAMLGAYLGVMDNNLHNYSKHQHSVQVSIAHHCTPHFIQA